MAIKVGIPRGLFFYEYYPLWKTYFEELGAQVIVSDYTTREILDNGVLSSVDDACLPVKLFHGHVIDLVKKVDYLFIPRFTSISKNEYVCPKFGGLPDMIKHSVKNLPPVIDTEINLRKSNKNAVTAALEAGRYFTDDKGKILSAYKKGMKNYKAFKSLVSKGLRPDDIFKGKNLLHLKSVKRSLNIAVISHMYNLYDSYSNMDLLQKLEDNDVNVITIDMMDENIIDKKANLLNKKMFWFFGRKAVGSAFHLLEKGGVDGVIYLMSFGCGVDSFVCDMVERKLRRHSNIPLMTLSIDEHSGEAGFNTRLEAFIDMIRWRNDNEADISSYG